MHLTPAQMAVIEVTIPVLNEEETLDKQVRTASAYLINELSDLGDLSLVIADNGSTDATSEIANKLASELPNVKAISVGERGVGRALKASWTQSSAEIVGYMDLDLATDLKHLRSALVPLIDNKADVVTGTRLASGSKVIGRPFVRAVTTRVFNFLLKIYMGANFSDGMCGFKFLRRENLAKIMDTGAQSNGWFFATEMLCCAQHLSLRTIDLPVTWTDDPNSKVKIGKLALEYIKAMQSLKKQLNSSK